MQDTKQVWVVAEHRDGKLLNVSLELLGKAKELARQIDGVPAAVVLGDKTGEMVRQLISHGADLVYQGESPQLATYQGELAASVLAKLAQERQPEIVLVGCTALGQELAASVAAKLDTGLCSHCVDLVVNEQGVLEQLIPAYGGMGKITCPVKRPQMATIGPGVFARPAADPGRSGEVVKIEIDSPAAQLGAETLSLVLEPPKGMPLEEAKAVVAGGAGIDGPEDWKLLEELARLLDGAVGATRPPVDEGWAGEEQMIGQSGRTVQPDFYLGIGISGELQHTVGIEGARMIVAINRDPKAPFFEQCDYGIVADYKDIVPLLIEKIRERKSQ